MPRNRILVIDDERDMRELLEIMLTKEGYEVSTASSGGLALAAVREQSFDLVITDLRMPGLSGIDFLKAVKEIDPDIIVIMITAYASVDTALNAMKAGAYDYFTKPFNLDEIKLNIRNALRSGNLAKENRMLKKELKARAGFSNLIGSSAAMQKVYGLIMSVASTRTNVLISGESGTGKELVARAIHDESDRKEAPFVAINCGAIPENLLESELFGHVKGAFTGAVSNKPGLAEEADGGTLFLDEITELPLLLQVKLLRFIQERNIRRVGGNTDLTVDVRIIAATNRDLADEVRAGRFREDLYYRLNVIEIGMPPLRERREDIPALARHFAEGCSDSLGKDVREITEGAMRILVDYGYTGNVRELENIIERAVTLEEGHAITPESLPANILSGSAGASPAGARASGVPSKGVPAEGMDLDRTVEEYEKAMLVDALRKSNGVKKKAAEMLGLSFRSMRYKLSKYDINDA